MIINIVLTNVNNSITTKNPFHIRVAGKMKCIISYSKILQENFYSGSNPETNYSILTNNSIMS